MSWQFLYYLQIIFIMNRKKTIVVVILEININSKGSPGYELGWSRDQIPLIPEELPKRFDLVPS